MNRREFVKLLSLLPLVKPKFELPEVEQHTEFVEPEESYTIQSYGTYSVIFSGKVEAYNQIDITSNANSAYIDMLTVDSRGIEYIQGIIVRGTSLECGNQKVSLSTNGELSLITSEDCTVRVDVDYL